VDLSVCLLAVTTLWRRREAPRAKEVDAGYGFCFHRREWLGSNPPATPEEPCMAYGRVLLSFRWLLEIPWNSQYPTTCVSY
jgi:hypothetical protein